MHAAEEKDPVRSRFTDTRKALEHPPGLRHWHADEGLQVTQLHCDGGCRPELASESGSQDAVARHLQQLVLWGSQNGLGSGADPLLEDPEGLATSLIIGHVGDVVPEHLLKRLRDCRLRRLAVEV